MASGRSCKRALVEYLDGNDDDFDRVYKFQILLPNGANVRLTLHDPGEDMLIDEFIHFVRKEVEKTGKVSHSSRRKIHWTGDIYLEDMQKNKIKKRIHLDQFKTNKCHILKLHDGGGPSVDTFHNMWDLTPDTDLLQELPAEYTFETALADLIDNSLQAVWSNAPGDRRLISVTIESQKIVIFDSGQGMDGSDENSISKWGKMGSSNHRSSRQIAIGGKAPYLMPFFGMFGYGGPIASMHLGRHAIVSSKTKLSKQVCTLHLSREALMKKSTNKCIWMADGGIRDPLDQEIHLSPHGSFTQVEICDLKLRCMEISKLQCLLKDIYFPYIQCDEELRSRKTTTPVEFQVNNVNLAGIEGGEIAISNMHSCNGPDFVINLHLKVKEGDLISNGSRSFRQASAQLKCVYFPISQGKETIDIILEKLHKHGICANQDFENYSRLSFRRLGRLLPDARGGALPFMEPKHRKGEKGQLLRRCCQRVKCYVDMDAGFSPTPSKTHLAHHDPFTLALKSFGTKPVGEETVSIEIHKDGKQMNLLQLDKEYHDWIIQMHDTYDEEVECGEDEPVIVIAASNKKKLGISAEVVRVHKVIRRKGLKWRSGQKIKILKGAVGCSKSNIYATLEYILLEGFPGDVGGEARLICRVLDCPEEKGCFLVQNCGNPKLEIHDSLSFPISEIDNGKILQVDDITWDCQIKRKKEKAPSKIDILNSQQCSFLNIQGELPVEHLVQAGYEPPGEIVAVIRPSSYTTSSGCKGFDQKHILKADIEMSMDVKLLNGGKSPQEGEHIFAERVKPSSCNGFHGLYIFHLQNKGPKLFRKAGVYLFSFSAFFKDSTCKREVKVTVEPSSAVGNWIIHDKEGPFTGKPIYVRAGSCIPYLSIACVDQYTNIIPFSTASELRIKVSARNFTLCDIDKFKKDLSSDHLVVEIKEMVVETSNLDMIRPSYGASLEIQLLKGVNLNKVPCIVMPGSLSLIKLQCSSDIEKTLSPGNIIEEFVLEMLDAYGNHVEEGAEVHIQVDGLIFHDNIGSIRKVNNKGYINLSGLLKVTASYGSTVRIFVSVDGKMLFDKVFQVVKRELRVLSGVPSYCAAGSHLKNVVFGIFDSNGVLDENVHGHHHTLTITTKLLRMDDSIQYTFQNGRCTVPAVPVPKDPGNFCFLAFHTHYPVLSTNIEVVIVEAPKLKLVPATDPDRIRFHPQSPDKAILTLPYSSQRSPSQMNLLVGTIMEDLKSIDEETEEAGLQVGLHEDKLKILNEEKDCIAKEICSLQGCMEPQYLALTESISNSREQVQKLIEEKGNTAAAVFCSLFKTTQSAVVQSSLMHGFIGLVALLGTVNDTKYSRILAEYVGENMLAIVCKSFESARTLEEYDEDGKIKRDSALLEAAATLGITINRRSPVICLEEIRPYKGGFKNGPQRRLALPKPLLPSGKAPAGFLGYAVNFIDLDICHLETRTAAGYGLRETLFYRLFGEAQVYDTREHMHRASACIKHGALSVDGGILRENGILLLGDHEPDTMFPVIIPNVQGTPSQRTIKMLEQIEEKKSRLVAVSEEISKESEAHSKALAKFQKKKDKLSRFLEKKSLGNLLEHCSSLQ